MAETGALRRALALMDSLLPLGCWASLLLMAVVFAVPLVIVLVGKL